MKRQSRLNNFSILMLYYLIYFQYIWLQSEWSMWTCNSQLFYRVRHTLCFWLGSKARAPNLLSRTLAIHKYQIFQWLATGVEDKIYLYKDFPVHFHFSGGVANIFREWHTYMIFTIVSNIGSVAINYIHLIEDSV